MSNAVRTDFARLSPFGGLREYLMWANNVRDYLAEKNLIDTIFSGTECSDQQKAQALQYMRRHLNEDFRNEYNLEFDPLVLWQSLKDHFDRMKPMELPRAKSDWQQLHFSDFDSVTAYNSVLRRRVLQLKICDQEVTDEEMIEKTYVPAKSAYAPSVTQGGKLSVVLEADLYAITIREGRSGAHEKSSCQSNPEGGFQEKEKTESEAKV